MQLVGNKHILKHMFIARNICHIKLAQKTHQLARITLAFGYGMDIRPTIGSPLLPTTKNSRYATMYFPH